MAKLKDTLLFCLHSILVFSAGVSVSYFIQMWKLQLKIDSSLYSLRFVFLAIACGFLAYASWLSVAYIYARLRKKDLGKFLQADSYSYCAFFPLLAYYPYLERSFGAVLFIKMVIGYYLLLKVLLFVTSELGKPFNSLRFSFHGRIGLRLVFCLCVILSAYDLHQTSLASYLVEIEKKRPLMINFESRKCRGLPWDKSVENELELPKDGVLDLAYGFTEEMTVRGHGLRIPKTLQLTVREHDSEKKHTFSFPLEHSAGWHDIRLRLQDIPVHHPGKISVRASTRTLIPWLFRNPLSNNIAIADSFVVENSSHEHPNVILVTIDALRSDHIHSLGNPKKITDVLDYLISDGVAFSSAVSAATWTIPSNISMVTSIFSQRNNNSVDVEKFPHDTLVEVFARNNYLTAAVTDGGWLSSETAFMNGFDIFEERRCVSADCKSETNFRKAERLIDQWKDHPFFIWLYCDEVHNTTWHSVPECGECNPNGQQGLIENYDAALERFDNSLGRFVHYLKEKGLYEHTILLLTADHGNAFGEGHNDDEYVSCGHGGIPYNEQIKIPLIIKPQEGESFLRGRVISGYVSNIDIAPTLVDLAGLEIPKGFEGLSLAPAARGERLPNNRPIYCSSENYFALPYELCVIKGSYKMIYPMGNHPRMNIRIYDLSHDPGEKVNIFRNSLEQQEMVQDMKKFITDAKAFSDFSEQTVRVPFSRELSDQLRGLGYIQ